MTYEEAVSFIAEMTGSAHDERCFEAGECDLTEQAARARREAVGNALRRVDEAEQAIREHVKRRRVEASTRPPQFDLGDERGGGPPRHCAHCNGGPYRPVSFASCDKCPHETCPDCMGARPGRHEGCT